MLFEVPSLSQNAESGTKIDPVIVNSTSNFCNSTSNFCFDEQFGFLTL